jgi:uncharacterized protein
MNKKILIVGLLLSLLLAYSFIEPYWIENKTIVITDKDIPQEFDNTKLVFITDIHHGPFFNINRVKRLVRRVNRLKPDLILLGGDYVHRSPKYIQPCFNELKRLKAPLGILGVLGNHDHVENTGLSRQSMIKAGIVLLDNKGVWIRKKNRRIKIGGVGDFFYGSQNINATIHDVKKQDFVILVTHNPDYIETLKTSKIDLVLAGHTHGGQVTLFGLWAPLVPSHYGQKYRTGIIQLSNTKVVVSNGIGTITPPVRFCARPQIVIIILKHYVR